jgi:predicted HTH domain antitoxin
MDVKTYIKLPEDIYQTLSSHGFDRETLSKEMRKLLALKCYRENILSLEKSVDLSGLSMWEFIEFLSDNGVPVIDYDEEEISREITSVKEIKKVVKIDNNL